MTGLEFDTYWRPARDKLKTFPISNPYMDSKKLAALLKIKHPFPTSYSEIELTEDLKRKLKMLAGPHSAVIIKMLEMGND